MNLQFTIYDLHKLTLKSLGGGGQFDRATCGFSKNIASIEKVKPCFL